MRKRRGRWGVLVAVLLGAVLIAPAVGAGGVTATTAQEDVNNSSTSSEWTVDGLRELGPHPSNAPDSLRPVATPGATGFSTCRPASW